MGQSNSTGDTANDAPAQDKLSRWMGRAANWVFVMLIGAAVAIGFGRLTSAGIAAHMEFDYLHQVTEKYASVDAAASETEKMRVVETANNLGKLADKWGATASDRLNSGLTLLLLAGIAQTVRQKARRDNA